MNQIIDRRPVPGRARVTTRVIDLIYVDLYTIYIRNQAESNSDLHMYDTIVVGMTPLVRLCLPLLCAKIYK